MAEQKNGSALTRCTLKDFGYLVIGTFLLSLGVSWFADPAGLVVGGISGLAIVIKEISAEIVGFSIPLAVTNLVLNIPLYLINLKQRGFYFVQKSIYAVILMTLFLWLVEYIPNVFHFEDDLLLAGLACGVLSGAGIGLVMRVNGTTGGTELLAAIIKYIKPHFPIAKLIFIIDAVIIAVGFFIFGPERTMYAVISVYVCSKIIDGILEGVHFAKEALIISDKTTEISEAIFKYLDRGNTKIAVQGMYTQKHREMLMVIVSKKEIATLRQIVTAIDPKAFFTIADVHEVVGEGFNENFDELSLG
ncbi:MAG: YitT family protein [Eubacterium sp.]|nr:YitT family protein [Eubacterium sp.]